MKLLVISHTPHYMVKGNVAGWGPTVREIDQLARLFDEVLHLAPLHNKLSPNHALSYTTPNVQFRAVKPAEGETFRDKLKILWRIPGWLTAMRKEISQADSIHIRCPAGISLVGLVGVCLWAKGKPIWVKYAGNWDNYTEQPLSYKFQRWFLIHNFHDGRVTINNDWNKQSNHIHTFQNPSYSKAEYDIAKLSSQKKQLTFPVKLLFVGSLTRAKGVHRVLKIARELRENNFYFDLTLVGDSAERPAFEAYVNENHMERCVHFVGWQPMTALGKFYSDAHFFVLPSSSEGWPKVLSEAMAYGVVPLASSVSSIPQILRETGAGLAIPADNTEAYVDAIMKYSKDVQAWKQFNMNGILAGRKFTYEYYLSAVKRLYQCSWEIELTYG